MTDFPRNPNFDSEPDPSLLLSADVNLIDPSVLFVSVTDRTDGHMAFFRAGSAIVLQSLIHLMKDNRGRDETGEIQVGAIRGYLEQMTDPASRIPEAERTVAFKILANAQRKQMCDTLIRAGGGLVPKLTTANEALHVALDHITEPHPGIADSVGTDNLRFAHLVYVLDGWTGVHIGSPKKFSELYIQSGKRRNELAKAERSLDLDYKGAPVKLTGVVDDEVISKVAIRLRDDLTRVQSMSRVMIDALDVLIEGDVIEQSKEIKDFGDRHVNSLQSPVAEFERLKARVGASADTADFDRLHGTAKRMYQAAGRSIMMYHRRDR